jgi:hypothetical protein
MTLGELIAEAKSLVGEDYEDVVLTVMDGEYPSSINSVQTAEATNNRGETNIIMVLECLDDEQLLRKSIDVQTHLIANGVDFETTDDSIIAKYEDNNE